MKITVATVTYNAKDTLEQVMYSVRMQNYKNIEYIVIDGGSNDGTIDIIKKNCEIVTKWISEKDDGIYDAMNKAINLATGDYILFLGADDSLIDENTISDAAKLLLLYDKPDILSTLVYFVDHGNLQRIKKRFDYTFENCTIPFIHHQGAFVKTELMKKNLFDISYTIIADRKFFFKCFFDKNVIIRYSDFITSYYAADGISGNSKYQVVMKKEMNNLLCEMNMKMIPDSKLFLLQNRVHEFIKKVLGIVGLKKVVLRFFFGWKIHKCINPKCIWCHRC